MHVPAGLKIPLIYQEMTTEAEKTFERNSIMIMKLARISHAEKVVDFRKEPFLSVPQGQYLAFLWQMLLILTLKKPTG